MRLQAQWPLNWAAVVKSIDAETLDSDQRVTDRVVFWLSTRKSVDDMLLSIYCLQSQQHAACRFPPVELELSSTLLFCQIGDCLIHERFKSRVKEHFVFILYRAAARCSSWQWPTDPTHDPHRTPLSAWAECCVWPVCLPPGPRVLAASFQGYFNARPTCALPQSAIPYKCQDILSLKLMPRLLSTANTLNLFWSRYSC